MPPEPKDTIEAMRVGLEEFKARQAREVEDLDARVLELETVQARGIPLPGTSRRSTSSPEIENGVGAYVRSGDPSHMRAAATIGSDPEGGYLVPPQFAGDIIRMESELSAMRRVSDVRQSDTSPLTSPADIGGTTAAWVDEQEPRTETNTSQLATVDIYTRELYALPKITQRALDQMSNIDAARWIMESAAEALADLQNTAFVTGDGVKKPRGFLNYPTDTASDATRAWGTLQHVKTGAATSFATASATVSPADCLIDVVHSLRSRYRRGARWMMNSATAAVIRKFKDADGRYIWQQSVTEGQPSLLLGYPVEEDEGMPDIAGDAIPVAFGNWKRGYRIVDFAPGMRVLRDPFTNKPWVYFYLTQYIGGAVTNSQAIKLLKVEV